jgi:hypothetical protein
LLLLTGSLAEYQLKLQEVRAKRGTGKKHPQFYVVSAVTVREQTGIFMGFFINIMKN